MTDDRPNSDATPAPADDVGRPASLDPLSLGCLGPFAIIFALVGLAWYGLQTIKASTGEMSLLAAEYGLDTSGLPAQAKAPFAAEVERLRAGHESETLDAQQVVGGVAGLLETRTIQLLVVDDVRTRRLPASGLTAEERGAASEVLGTVAVCVDAQALPLSKLLEVLGPLAEVPEDGSVVPLDDDGLRALVARARERLEGIEVPDEPRSVDAASLLERFRAHVTETLAAASADEPDAGE